jgi:DNA-binding response OmpR family regulator
MENRAIIVDDEAARCELIEKVLTSAGIESLTVTKSQRPIRVLNAELSLARVRHF